MKQFLSSLFFLCVSFLMLGQETEHKPLLKAETTWAKEIFTFPIGFAQEIPLEGYEEAIFPKGWSAPESPEFWSYIFAWKVTANQALTASAFEKYLELYFDGLMDIRNLKSGDSIVPTNALVIQTKETENSVHYTGKIRLYEGRYTKKMMSLSVLATQYFCEVQQKTIVVFRFSPKEFTHAIWDTLKKVELQDNICKI